MSDLQRYIQKRKIEDEAFADGFDEGYEPFKIDVLLRQLRENEGLTQDEIGKRLNTKKLAIFRIYTLSDEYDAPYYYLLCGVGVITVFYFPCYKFKHH